MRGRGRGSTASLAMALTHHWEPRRSVFVIVTIYIDESGTHDSPVVILGGCVGRLGQWASFDDKWPRLLKKYSLTYFHSKEMRHGENEFSGWTLLRKQSFIADAAKLARKNMSFGFMIQVRLDDYKKYYIGQERLKGVSIDSPYGLCFRHCVGLVTELVIDKFKDKPLDVHFVLESGHKNFGNAEMIFREVKATDCPARGIQRIKSVLRTISFGDKEEWPGLQIADANAYAAFQIETRDNQLEFVPLPNEGTLHESGEIQKFPIFRLSLSEFVLMQYRKMLLDQIKGKAAKAQSY